MNGLQDTEKDRERLRDRERGRERDRASFFFLLDF